MGEAIFKKTSSVDPVTDYLVEVLSEHLQKGQAVTWLVTGGSAIAVAVEVSKKLAGQDLANLSVTLTDERFVPMGNPDSNWQQLVDAGFNLPGAQLNPILNNKDSTQTTFYYDEVLRKLLEGDGYKIGLFGMGPDGHVAALFPNFPQINEAEHYAVYLEGSPKPPAMRMTMTIPAIQKLNEAVLFTRGKEKRPLIEELQEDVPLSQQPAQILKSLPKLTIFNDQIGE